MYKRVSLVSFFLFLQFSFVGIDSSFGKQLNEKNKVCAFLMAAKDFSGVLLNKLDAEKAAEAFRERYWRERKIELSDLVGLFAKVPFQDYTNPQYLARFMRFPVESRFEFALKILRGNYVVEKREANFNPFFLDLPPFTPKNLQPSRSYGTGSPYGDRYLDLNASIISHRQWFASSKAQEAILIDAYLQNSLARPDTFFLNGSMYDNRIFNNSTTELHRMILRRFTYDALKTDSLVSTPQKIMTIETYLKEYPKEPWDIGVSTYKETLERELRVLREYGDIFEEMGGRIARMRSDPQAKLLLEGIVLRIEKLRASHGPRELLKGMEALIPAIFAALELELPKKAKMKLELEMDLNIRR